jgi:hypothetical protein
VLARCLLFYYAVVLTLLHVPFPMLTRLRIPFMDPLGPPTCDSRGAPVGVRMLLTLPGEMHLKGDVLCETLESRRSIPVRG